MIEAEWATNYDYEFLVGTFNLSSAKDACDIRGKTIRELVK